MTEEFLQEDLKYIKENLNLKILNKKDDYESSILYYLFRYNKDLETIKYVFDFTQKNCPKLFFSKNNFGLSILHCFFWHNKELETIKYVLDFTKNNYPSLFLEKDNYGFTIPHYLFWNTTKKYVRIRKYVFSFIRNNFPELITDKIEKKTISEKNVRNHLILPFTFQIQN